MGFLIVFLGGGIGAALRHGVNLASARLLGAAFPYATLFENVTGSLAMGVLAGYFAFKGERRRAGGCSSPPASSAATPPSRPSRSMRRCLRARRARPRGALRLASVALSIGGLFAGLALVRQFS